MPVTLAQAKLNAQEDLDVAVIDEFQKSSWLLDNMTFKDVVNPAGGGDTLTYGYNRLITQATAGFRAINAEYTPGEVTKQHFSVELKPLGGSFQIDRVLTDIGPAAAGEVALQMSQKIKATNAAFSDAVVNGDTAIDANGFDGLSKALVGSSTELGSGTYLDWTGINTEALAHSAIDVMDLFLSVLDGEPSAVLGNLKLILKLKSIARRAGYLEESIDGFGRNIVKYGNVVLIDPGKKAGSNNDIIPVETRDVDGVGAGGNITGVTDMYAVRLGLDAFHGVSVTGGRLVKTWLPDHNTAGAVKTGEVEMGPVAVALKRSKSAAVYRNIKVQ